MLNTTHNELCETALKVWLGPAAIGGHGQDPKDKEEQKETKDDPE